MAIHNEVHLYGQIVSAPRIIKDPNTGAYMRGICTMKVIRGPRNYGEKIKKLQFDSPVILTNNPDQIKEMDTWDINDMVHIKGFFASKNIKKKMKCPECGKVNEFAGSLMYVQPIFLERLEKARDGDEANNYLKKKNEISNNVTALGTLCRDVTSLTTKKGLPICQFQMAVNRKFHVKEDNPDIKADYPWIKAYAKVADECGKVLHQGSSVFIDGIIQTREIEREETCQHCSESFKWKEVATEVVPYAVEFLTNCNSLDAINEEEKKKEEEEVNQLLKDTFTSETKEPKKKSTKKTPVDKNEE